MKIRIDKLLSNMGKGSRREVHTLIRRGKVSIDGEICFRFGEIIDTDLQKVSLCGEEVRYVPFLYLMLHKPGNTVSATSDNRHATVIDLVPEEYGHYDLFPVGRLDVDTTGLLLLTNDGDFSHRIASPASSVEKLYLAVTVRRVSDLSEAMRMFAQGVNLGDRVALPAKLFALEGGIEEWMLSEMAGLASRQEDAEHRLEILAERFVREHRVDEESGVYGIVVTEGKFHQVKRMMEVAGVQVTALRRVRIGGLLLDESLPLGGMREITPEERALLFVGGL